MSAPSDRDWRENIESSVQSLGDRLEKGIASLGAQISRNQDVTDARMSAQQERNDTKFESLQQQNLTQLSARSSAQWQIFAYIGSSVIGLAGVAAVFWGLAKSPIDEKFGRHDSALMKLDDSLAKLADYTIRDQPKDLDAKLSNYVPKAQILETNKALQDGEGRLIDRMDKVEQGVVLGVQDRLGIRSEIARNVAELKELRDDFKTNVVSRHENENRWSDILSRINSLFDRLNAVQANVESLKNRTLPLVKAEAEK